MPKYILTIEEINTRKPTLCYWTAIEIFGVDKNKQKLILCRCKCGVIKIVNAYSIVKGVSKSCGCIFTESRFSIDNINTKKPSNSFLTAIRFNETIQTGKERKFRHIECLCKCGNTVTTRMSSVINGHTWSCGCQSLIKIKKGWSENKKSVKYSQYHPFISGIYRAMIRRCYNIKCKAYKNYGAKSVKVCEEWRNDYQLFLDWALLSGWRKGLHLDKDIKGDGLLYSADTCCFVTPFINLANRSITKKAFYNGVLLSLSEISLIQKVPVWVMYSAVRKTGEIDYQVIKKHKNING